MIFSLFEQEDSDSLLLSNYEGGQALKHGRLLR
jgi:hypothetical protein